MKPYDLPAKIINNLIKVGQSTVAEIEFFKNA